MWWCVSHDCSVAWKISTSQICRLPNHYAPCQSDRNLSSVHDKINSRPSKNFFIVTAARLLHELTIYLEDCYIVRVVSAVAPTAKQKKCLKTANGTQPFWQWLEVLMLVNIILAGPKTKWDFFMIAMSGQIFLRNLNSYIIGVSCLFTLKPARATFIFRLSYQQTYQAQRCINIINPYLKTY